MWEVINAEPGTICSCGRKAEYTLFDEYDRVRDDLCQQCADKMFGKGDADELAQKGVGASC